MRDVRQLGPGRPESLDFRRPAQPDWLRWPFAPTRDAPKHRGITAFLVPMGHPRRGSPSAATDDRRRGTSTKSSSPVSAPDDHRLGGGRDEGCDRGVDHSDERASHRRGAIGAGPVASALSERWSAPHARHLRPSDDRALRGRLAELLADFKATEYLNARALRASALRRAVPGPGDVRVQADVRPEPYPGRPTFVSDVLGPRLIADNGTMGHARLDGSGARHPRPCASWAAPRSSRRASSLSGC